MYKLLRYYNQNRKQIWITIIIIVFVFFIVQVLNELSKQQNEKDKQENNQNKETTSNNVVSYDKESKSIISQNDILGQNKNEFGKLIDEFFTYCINHKPKEAYELLSNDTKSNIYESEVIFEKLYYSDKFEGDKKYSFQAWLNDNNRYTYQVKIYEDMLSTGNANNSYIEDYVTVVNENDKYVLNINGYIGKEQINMTQEKDNILLRVTNKYVYKDYEIFEIIVKNNTNNKILIDTRKEKGTIYLTDNKGNKFYALLNENSESDLLIDSNKIKNIKIKFNIVQREEMKVKSINFNDIVTNYEGNISGEDKNNISEIVLEFY